MPPKTYIGPFGRILPVPEESEPEHQYPTPDEERAKSQLPQPELRFGSDTTLGFSDPTRYNVRNQVQGTLSLLFLRTSLGLDLA